MSSRWVYVWDAEAGQWKTESTDSKVTSKFNKFAEENNVNPVSHSIHPSHHHSDNGKKLTVIHTLCASVIDREQQAQMELAYREQIARLASVLAKPVSLPQAAPTQAAPAPDPVPTAPAPEPVAAAPVEQAVNPLEPVDIHALADAPPSGLPGA